MPCVASFGAVATATAKIRSLGRASAARARNTYVGFSSVDILSIHGTRRGGRIIEFRLKGCFTTRRLARSALRSRSLASSINLRGFSRVRFQSSPLAARGFLLTMPCKSSTHGKTLPDNFTPYSTLPESATGRLSLRLKALRGKDI